MRGGFVTLLAFTLVSAAMTEPAHASVPTLDGNVAILHPSPSDVGNVQHEPFVAVNPTNGNHIVVGANDYRNSGVPGAGWAVSTDGGGSWTDGTFDNPNVMPAQVDACCDPSIAFSPDGTRIYYAMLARRADASDPGGNGGCEGESGIYVGRSTNGGTAWSVVNAAPSGSTAFNDKEMITTDPNTGTVYMTYTKFIYSSFASCKGGGVHTSSPIKMRKSTNGGVAWSAEIDVSGPFVNSQGSQPVVAPNGTVYVAFASQAVSGCAQCIVVAKSTNGGSSWTRSVVSGITGPYGALADATDSFRANNFPSIALAPNSRIFVVWADSYGSSGSEIFYSTSPNGAAPWTHRVRVNQSSAGDQFFPWITIDGRGTAWVGYLDRRDDAGNNLYREYVSHAHVGTANPPYSWTDTQVATQASDPSATLDFGGPSPKHFIGDYTGIAARPGGRAFAVWVDARNGGDQDVYGDTVSLGNSPPSLNGVGDKTVAEGSALGFTLTASDSDGDPVVFQASGLPSGASLNRKTGRFSWTPGYKRAGVYQVTFSATDGRDEDPSPETITITVADTPAGLPGTIDDNIDLWTYSSGWTLNSHSQYAGGTRHVTNASGAFAEIPINGGAWRYNATMGPNMGIVEVYVDGALYTRVDLYSRTTVQQVAVSERPMSGTHTIRIKRSGSKNPASSAANINIDSLFISANGVTAGVYQDTHPTAWKYTGTWSIQSSSAYSGGARHYSNSRLSRANIVVKGWGVEFRATKGPNMGILNIWMDGVRIMSANLYRSSTANGQTILRRSLPAGYHVFRLEVVGARDSRSTSGQINFDACIVT